MATAHPRWRAQVLWAAASQLTSSVTNLSLHLVLLIRSDRDGFGRLVAVLAVYQLGLALSRSLVSEAMVAAGRPGGTGGFSWRWARQRLRLVGAGVTAGTLLVGLLIGADGPAVLTLALAGPLLIHQDGLRNLAWARGRPDLAVTLDGLWVVVTGGLLGLAFAVGVAQPTEMVLAWTIGGVAGALVGSPLVAGRGLDDDPSPPDSRLGRAPDPVDPARSDARRRSQALLTTARNLLPIAVAVLVSPAAAGLLKATLLPFTPILSIFAGLRVVTLPAMHRAAEGPEPGGLDRFVVRLVAAYALVAGLAVLAVAVALTELFAVVEPPESIRPGLLGWGAVIALLTILVTPLADAVGLGRRPVPAVPLRLVDLALEWSAVFAVALLVDEAAVVVGWAVGMALGALVWLSVGVVSDRARRLDGCSPDHPPAPSPTPPVRTSSRTPTGG